MRCAPYLLRGYGYFVTRDQTPSNRSRPESGLPVERGAAIKAHVTLAFGLMFCAAAFWFELHRAESGNSLSWAYVFEWPLLAGFAVYMWWKVLHPDAVHSKRRRDKTRPELAPEFDSMRAAWEEQQRELVERRNEAVGGTFEEPAS